MPGVSRNAPFEQVTDEIWREDFDQKLFAAIRLTRLVWPQLKERRWGRIINTLNIGAKAPRPASAPTSVTRAAGMALTKVLAGEGGPFNILVNALLIGFIEADQHVRAAARNGVSLQDYMSERSKEIPLGRPGPGRGVRQPGLLSRLRCRAPTSPAPPSTWTAGCRGWCDSGRLGRHGAGGCAPAPTTPRWRIRGP